MMSRCVSIILAFAVCASSAFGLSQGMALCVDDTGRVALEAAHVEHAHRHATGEEHGHDDAGLDPDHQTLHRAIDSCFDIYVGMATANSPRMSGQEIGKPTAVVVANTAAAALNILRVFVAEGLSHCRGDAARAELTCLSGIILLV